MRQNQYFLTTLLYIILILFINQVLSYNVTLTNLRVSSQSIFWSLILVYSTIIMFINSKRLVSSSEVTIRNYSILLNNILTITLLSIVFLIINDLVITREISTATYIKFGITLFLVSLVISLIYFLEASFYKYRVLWLIGFVGTVILAPLLVEAGMFVRDLRFKSLLDFWNWIVPYQAIDQLRQFVLLEGWQGWDIALGSAFYLVAYWFVVASICLYVRQLQVSWKLPEVQR